MAMDPVQLPLRDIHLPEPVSWWPPAPGWWLLSIGIALLVAGLAWWYRRRQRYYRSVAYLAGLQFKSVKEEYSKHGDNLKLARELSALLRRMCVSVYPRTETASLTGRDWLALLDKSVAGEPFTNGPGRILVEAPYKPEADMDADSLLSLCQEWIENVVRNREKLKP